MSRFSKHKMCYTRIYNIWRGMKQRCNYKKGHYYKYYGGRGIKFCDEWEEFLPFYEWAMANGYSDDLTLDRIDVDGNYCPENCRFVSRSTQMANQRSKSNTEYIGVCDKGSYFVSKITHNYKIVFTGYSKSKNECAKKRNDFIIKNGLEHKLNDIKPEFEFVYPCKVMKPSKEHIEKLKRANSKKVIQYDLNMNKIGDFSSVRQAARAIGKSESYIGFCCRNKDRACGGYRWRYADDPT